MVSMLFAVVSVQVSAATEGFYTYMVSNGEAIITEVDNKISGDVVEPSMLGEYPVTGTVEAAFKGCNGIKSVTFSEGFTDIGEHTFMACKNLESVEIPDSVTSIGAGAFYECTSLKRVEMGKGVEYIGEEAFKRCESLDEVSYHGTEKQWNEILIERGNSFLEDATISFMPEEAVSGKLGDINGDEKITVYDAVEVLRIVAGVSEAEILKN